MRCVLAAAQDIGDRPEQQDRWAFWPPDRPVRGGVVGVIADGMGGMKNGAQAAQTAVEVFIREYQACTQDESIPNALQRALRMANSAVYLVGQQAGVEGEIAATLAAAVLDAGKLHWISVGDSRAYILRGGELFRLTVDHVLGTELDDQAADGLLSWQDARSHTGREDVTRCLGMPGDPVADCSLEPLRLGQGDVVILCSDGVYRALTEDEIAACCVGVEPQSACNSVREAVRSRRIPDQDNHTVLVMALSDAGKRPRARLWRISAIVFLIFDMALVYYLTRLLRDLYRSLRSSICLGEFPLAVWSRTLGGGQIT